MNYRQIFHKTLQEFKIQAKSLSEATGVQERQISNFRNNKGDLVSETFFKLVEALPPEAKAYFYSELRGSDFSYSSKLEEIIDNASDEEIQVALLAIARRWGLRNSQEKCA